MPRCIACLLFKGEGSTYHPPEVILQSFDVRFQQWCALLHLDDQKISRTATGTVNRSDGNLEGGAD